MSIVVGIQWKATNAALEFNCEVCGALCSFDGWGAYALRCPSCRTVYRMPDQVAATQIAETDIPPGAIVDADA